MKDLKTMIAVKLSSSLDLNYDEVIAGLEKPKHRELAHFAFPCFKLSKTLKKSPQQIAEEMATVFLGDTAYESVTAVSGYLNFKFTASLLAEIVFEEAFTKRETFGATPYGEGKTAIVEFSSTNIAKPFHVGHIRSTMIGNSLYKMHKFLGFNTIGINHLGDYGTQFGKLIVAFKLWGNKEDIENDPIPELLKIYVRFHEEAESNPELDNEARQWFTRLENNDQEAYDLWVWFKAVSLKEFNRVYDLLGVQFDSYAGESFYSDKMPAVLDEMRAKGILKKDQGAEIVDFGENSLPPALITKSDGSSLYITRDLAAAIYRKNHYNFDRNVYVVGTTQKLHFKQWMKIIEMMGYEWAKDCVHVDFGTVSLEEGTMATRKGKVVFLEDVLKKATELAQKVIEEKNPDLENKEEVAKQIGIGAVIFQELSNNRIKDYMFSWEQSMAFEGETGPYVQYTHARAGSLLRKAGFQEEININTAKLSDTAAVDLLFYLYQFKDVLIEALDKYEPSIVTRFIVDVAQAFNRFYHDNMILCDDLEERQARVALVYATKLVLKVGLDLIGLKAPDRM
jgi:arginyl-tRNA synthetase